MILRDISFQSPEDNIVFDEVLLARAEENQELSCLRFWESPHKFIVLGRIGKEAEELNGTAVREDAIPVLRRASGGGTVIQGPGCLNYSVIISKKEHSDLEDLRKSYVFLLNKVVMGLASLGVVAEAHPISDIAFVEDQKKFSGNAQKRGRAYILHHGTLLYNFDLTCIQRYLAFPKDRPEYRNDRSHLDFVRNLPLEDKQIKVALAKSFGVQAQDHSVSKAEKDLMLVLKEKRLIHVSLA